jgi:hypothetical protein
MTVVFPTPDETHSRVAWGREMVDNERKSSSQVGFYL